MRAALLLASALALGAMAPQERPAPAAGEAPRPRLPTRLAMEYMAPADAVIVARTESVSMLGTAVAVVRVRVLERIHTRPGIFIRTGREVVFMTHSGQLEGGTEELLYLKRFGRGDRFEMQFRVAGKAKDFIARLAVTRRTAELMRIEEEDARLDALLEWLATSVEFGDAWTARYAAEELETMAANHGWAFTPASATRIRQASEGSRNGAVSARVMIVANQLKDRFERLSKPEEKGPSRP